MQKPLKRFASAATACMMAFSCLFFRPDLSSYAADSEYKTWLQMDSRWGSKNLGSGYATVAEYGCLATSLAMMAVHSGTVTSDSFNPGVFVDDMNEVGGFDYYGSLSNWSLVSEAVPGLKCEGKFSVPEDMTKQEYIEKVKELNDLGYYMVCFVGNHWVMVDYIEGDTIYMCDPGSNETNMLEEYEFYTYSHDTIRYFSGKNIPDKSTDNVPNNTESSKIIYTITADVLNVRSQANTGSEILGTLSYGDEVEVSEISQNWGKINFNGTSGWICLDYAELLKVEETYKPGIYSITASSLNLRENPDSSSSSLGLIPNGTLVEVNEFSDNWGKTSYDGADGWISMDYAEYVSEATTETTTTTTTTTTPTTTTVTTTTMATETVSTELTTVTTAVSSFENSGTVDTFISELPPKEYIIKTQSADIMNSENQVVYTAYQNNIVKVKSIKNGLAEIVFDGSTASISADSISPIENTVQDNQKGDINCDGVIDKIDISWINSYILSKEVFPEGISILTSNEIQSADYNNDGIVNNDDIIQLLILICN